jgi:hypothetical protein
VLPVVPVVPVVPEVPVVPLAPVAPEDPPSWVPPPAATPAATALRWTFWNWPHDAARRESVERITNDRFTGVIFIVIVSASSSG